MAQKPVFALSLGNMHIKVNGASANKGNKLITIMSSDSAAALCGVFCCPETCLLRSIESKTNPCLLASSWCQKLRL